MEWSEYKGAILGSICKYGHDHGGGSYRAQRKCVECTNGPGRREYLRVWRGKNPAVAKSSVARWKSQNPALVREQNNEWRKRNMPRFAGYAASRRSRKLMATPVWADPAAMQEKYAEAARRTTEEGVIYEVDHIIPLSHPLVCGLHVEHNLQVLSIYENAAKNNRFVP